ncbi:MAG: hypothetical protein LBV12_12945 [Puniceicoccales bacterium]|nr:hypothetical protein [Puniceicoccales bacterium]
MPSLSARHFTIDQVRFQEKRPKTESGTFAPCVEVRLGVEANMPIGKSYAVAYFFDENKKQVDQPVSAKLPLDFHKTKPFKVRFDVPDTLLKKKNNWRAVVVFGDDKDATALLVAGEKGHIRGDAFSNYAFPQKKLCSEVSQTRAASVSSVYEIQCSTNLPDYPHLTLFLKLPKGVKSAKEANGVLCLSILAGSLSEVRISLMNEETDGRFSNMLRYADKHKLVVICWGSRGLWDPSRNWDELKPEVAREADRRFDRVAAAWENGIRRLATEHGFEPRSFLLWGNSGSAQYSMRLALRKPQYFNAVFIQIPSSFDKPTKAASQVLWCLATGELESGYVRSQRFYRQCTDLGYRFIYKAVPGLGHVPHEPSQQMGLSFFDYARTLPDKPEDREKRLQEDMGSPPFWGDWLNQNVEAKGNLAMIPEALRVPLPTQEIAQKWEMQKKK